MSLTTVMPFLPGSSPDFLTSFLNVTPTTVDSNMTSVNPTEPLHPDPAYRDFREQSRFWVQRVLAPLIMIIGVVGNSITIVVLTRRRMRSSTNCYLAALAIFDMLYLILFFSLSLSHYSNTDTEDFYPYYRCFGVMLMLTDACSNTSVWLTTTFTIERYIAVCHPIKRKVICTESRAKKVVFAVFVVCFLCTIPTPFEWTVQTRVDLASNQTLVRAVYSEFGRNMVYKKVYYWVTVVLFIFIPFVLLAVFNSFLIWAVHQSKSQRRLMTMTQTQRDSANQENKITIMLIAVVILFLICQLPTAVMLVYTSAHVYPLNSNSDALITGLNNIFNILMASNASCNFVLYCVLSEKYRRTFHKVFCKCTHREGYVGHSNAMNTTMVDYDISSTSPSAGRRRSSAVLGRSSSGSVSASGGDRKPSPAGRRPDLLLHEKSNFLTVSNVFFFKYIFYRS